MMMFRVKFINNKKKKGTNNIILKRNEQVLRVDILRVTLILNKQNLFL